MTPDTPATHLGQSDSYAAFSNQARAEYENEQLVEKVRELQRERNRLREALGRAQTALVRVHQAGFDSDRKRIAQEAHEAIEATLNA